MSTSELTSHTLMDRMQMFVSENKRAILIGTAAAIAVGGVAYYASTSSRRGGEPDVEKSPKRKKKSKSGKKGKKSVKDADGPILEEKPAPKPKVEDDGESDDPLLQPQSTESLSEEERTVLALELKTKGNTAYSQRKYVLASKYYSRAIEVSPKPDSVFYSNRAACYMNFAKPDYEKVVLDCDEALKNDPMYIKALNRRASALEHLARLEEALRDYTALTILEKFQNQHAASTVERLIKTLAETTATNMLASREKHLPPDTFVEAYFGAFRSRPHPTLPAEPSTGDKTLIFALEALDAKDFKHAFTLVNESFEQGISFNEGQAWALNLRGSFRFLSNDTQSAKADLLAAIDAMPSFTQSWVKIASIYMELSDGPLAFEAFDKAAERDPKDADIYYHKGQVYFIMNDFNKAAECYTRSIALDTNFVFSHIQLAVAQYKLGNIANSMATFRRTLKSFAQRSEAHNYYGELLLDQQRFPDAIEKFDRAIELEKAKSSRIFNVLPMVNKGLAIFQWKEDIVTAESLIKEALAIDPDCEAAVATLAQMSLQQGKLDVAAEMFGKQTKLARTEVELVHALNYKFASDAQIEFMKNYPAMAKEFMELGKRQQRAMQGEAGVMGMST